MSTRKKIVKLATLKKRISELKKSGRKIAFTNGCFDILHYGHVSYLEAAKKKGRVLVVGLNSDSSVKKIKCPGRPVNSEMMRAYVLAALECVDFVTIFNEDIPYNLIKAVRPDVLIKGADWKNKGVVGSDIVKSYGGRVELIKYVPKMSTTNIIKIIGEKCVK